MKARVQKGLTAETKKLVREYVDGYEKEIMRRFIKLSCAALHDDEIDPFGPKKLARYIKKITQLAETQDEILWWHVDQLLIDRLGMPFEREKEG